QTFSNHIHNHHFKQNITNVVHQLTLSLLQFVHSLLQPKYAYLLQYNNIPVYYSQTKKMNLC
uniref:Uncharacterized protein n=1 Tax=Triticum urartu TaxID=4572 RepID=A0A8R7V6L8_TRIUA